MTAFFWILMPHSLVSEKFAASVFKVVFFKTLNMEAGSSSTTSVTNYH
jgi:hypothetical protein